MTTRSLFPPTQIQPEPTPIRKARKRLRGDPVTPSPSKSKRRPSAKDVRPSKAFDICADSDEDMDDVEDDSFVDDSPVKPAQGGRPFQMLFEDGPSTSSGSGSQLKASGSSIFSGAKSFGKASRDVFGGSAINPYGKRQGARARKATDVPKGLIASNDDPFVAGPSTSNTERSSSAPKGPRKRSRSVDNADGDNADGVSEEVSSVDMLVPPSPPRTDDINAKNGVKFNGKGKLKDWGASKKAKLALAEITDDDSLEDDKDILEMDWRTARAKRIGRQQRTQQLNSNDDDLENILDLDLQAHDSDSSHQYLMDSEFEDDEDDGGKFEVDLPEDMQTMLAISPSKSRTKEERELAESLLYGKRTKYDSTKGEIWDVGEDDQDVRNINEDEDDEWAGEGVPWEVGEL